MTLFLSNFFQKKVYKTKCLIWDIDGTLYRNTYGIFLEMCKITAKYIKSNTDKKYQEIVPTIKKGLKENLTLGQIVEKDFHLSENKLAIQVEIELDRSKYIQRNSRLIYLLEHELAEFEHIILTNSGEKNAIKVLKKIGLRKNIFNHIITLDTLKKDIKPSLNAFEEVYKKSRYKKNEYLMIGDSLYHDIIPAKKFGFRTCWINDDTQNLKSKEADLVIPSVLLLKNRINNF